MNDGVVRTSSSVCQVTLRWSRTRGGGHVSTSPLQVQSASNFTYKLLSSIILAAVLAQHSRFPEQVRRLAVLDNADCELTTIYPTPAGSALDH
jgi:hypothetical protein